MLKYVSRIINLFFLLLILNPEAGLSQNFWEQSNLSGNWGKERNRLKEAGLTISMDYAGEGFFNLIGGRKQGGTYLHSVGLSAAFDADKLLGWKGASIFVYGMANAGGKPSAYVGDAQGVSNIQAYSTVKLYEAWLQQELFRHKVSLLAGFYDLNSEFQHLESSTIFIASPYGIGTDIAQSGLNGPSIFPTPTLGLRLKFRLAKYFCFQTVVLNGLAGDPAHPGGTHLILDSRNGILSVTELQFNHFRETTERKVRAREARHRLGRLGNNIYNAKLALGAWFYTASFPGIPENTDTMQIDRLHGNGGIYLIGEMKVLSETADPKQGMSAFFRLGMANSRINRFGYFSSAGVVYTGLIPGRDSDAAGLAFAWAFNGKPYMNFLLNEGYAVDKAECDLELTYQWNVFPWLTVQPDFQYVINPNTHPSLKNALTFDLRASISF